MKHTLHKWGGNISSIHNDIGPPNTFMRKSRFYGQNMQRRDATKNAFPLNYKDPKLNPLQLCSQMKKSRCATLDIWWTYSIPKKICPFDIKLLDAIFNATFSVPKKLNLSI